ncbi:hypothetical protein JCM10914A_21990 [Paenibacillus sp. JCM 10914]|uniref:DUF3888 domain-containing protein n=1 Tax=Paenibacillus sp. JCM 10914 TaxID=1236974 RepID=UPI0003CCB5AE|nr:DUF3888 domain-containing protein [Paenibacillus sp. JCM 10914]GAE09353.1 hypothetical protein JCM10914_5711 [Paenibacillus sp. JCM 10914]
MSNRFIGWILAIAVAAAAPLPSPKAATHVMPQSDSEALQYHDIVMLLLLPQIDKAVGAQYASTLKEPPIVYPYYIDVTHLERVNGFRGFQFRITIEVYPVVGPHLTVGKDRLEFEIAPDMANGTAKLLDFKHLETHELPSHWQHVLK